MEHKYYKYKSKYNKLKCVLTGGAIVGTYRNNNNNYISATTYDGNYYSYYEVNPLTVQSSEYTKNVYGKPNKIYYIDNIDSFDKFTNKYATLYISGEDYFLRINWDQVSNMYKGFYIKTDNILKLQRYTHTYFKNKRVISWMSLESIPSNIMMFTP
jgi:hypothetical protein